MEEPDDGPAVRNLRRHDHKEDEPYEDPTIELSDEQKNSGIYDWRK